MDTWNEKIDKLKVQLQKPNLSAVIIPHISPDGDAVGSCSALAQVLQKVGISCHILTCDYIPMYLRFLKLIPEAMSYQDKREECKRLIAEADLIFITNMWNSIPLYGIIAWAMKAFSGWG